MTPLFIILSLAIVLAVSAVAVRDHKRLRAKRTSLLDDAAAGLEDASLEYGGDGFPRLRGLYRGTDVEVDLIPDTMVVRRLPQLWLSVTLLIRNPGLPGLGVLVRYSGNEFYSLTSRFAHRLEPPPGFPHEVLIRAERPDAQRLLDGLRQPLAKLLADPHIKEVAITCKGLRLVRQAAEGRRGEHLLLRQAIFDQGGIASGDLQSVLLALSSLHSAISQCAGAKAA